MVRVSLFGLRQEHFEETVKAAQFVESLGFDGLLFGEHHGTSRTLTPQLPILIAGLAARTSRLLLGSSILLSPLWNPVHLAETVAMLDRQSGGRFLFGVGIGYWPEDFSHFGLNIKHRVSRFEEGLEVMRRAWSEGPFSFEGKRFQFKDVEVFPKPLTSPHPPILVAAWSEPGAIRAGRLGDAYVTDSIQHRTAVIRLVERYEDAARAHGRTPSVTLHRKILCADSRAEAEDRFGESMMQTYRMYFEKGGFSPDLEPWANDLSSVDQLTFEDVINDRVIIGTPEDCIGQAEQWIQDSRADHLMLNIPADGSGRSSERLLESVRVVGERVLPIIRGFSS